MKTPGTLHIALGVSIALHAVLLAVHFADPQRFSDRVFQDMPLEVILVNARSSEKPDVANAIAQASLAGGGELAQGRATSPLPPSALATAGDAAADAQRQGEPQPEQRMQRLPQTKTDEASAALPPPETGGPADVPAQPVEEEKTRQLSKLLAEIEKRINEDSARPKKRYVSPATREEAYAVYYDALRRKIEGSGTANFPVMAGKKLYGELTMTMTVNFDGSVLDTEIVQSSGNPVLDRRARSIVQGSGPFLPFSDAMRRKAEQIVVVSHFNFTRDDGLQARLGQR